MKFPRLALLAVYGLFFLSGAAALVYEISWARQLGLLVGHTAQAASVVLGGYFAGLALGYWLAGRWASRVRPLAGYGVAEIAAGLWALAVPTLLAGIHRLDGGGGLLGGSIFVRALLALLVLLPATAALGATLPLVAALLARQGEKGTAQLTTAYALNTLGAVSGVVLATVVLLVAVGVAMSSYLAAGVSILCGLAALLLEGRIGRGVQDAAEESPSGKDANRSAAHKVLSPSPAPRPLVGWMLLAVLIGFVTLALEVLYTRLFSLVFHNSTYTFGAVVAVFLAALALGSLVVAIFGNPRTYGWLVALGCAGGAVAVPLSVVLFFQRTGLSYYSHGDSLASYLTGALSLVALIVLPPTALLGMVLPATWGAAKAASPQRDEARTVGMLTAANTIAATLGSLAAGFVLLPFAGLWGALAVVSGLAAIGAAAWLVATRSFVVAGVSLAATAVVAALFWRQTDGLLERAYQEKIGESCKLLAHWEGPYGWTDVIEIPGSLPYLSLRQNVHYGLGSDGPSTQREYLQSHLPLLLHPAPRQVAFLGLGTGLTAAPVTVHDEVESAVVVELIPEVVEAARLFEDSNLGVLEDPKVEVVIDDARHWLRTTDMEYDVIVSDLFVPWESETGYLYTVEHYKVARERLAEGGIFCQWLALYQMGPREFEMICDSFAEVFPHTSLWWGRISPSTPMVALMGSEEPLGPLDLAAIDARLGGLGETTGGQFDTYLRSGRRMMRLSIGRWPQRENVLLNTDEHPRVEFLAPASHRSNETLKQGRLADYFDEVLAPLPPVGVEGDDSPADADRRRAWQRIRLGY